MGLLIKLAHVFGLSAICVAISTYSIYKPKILQHSKRASSTAPSPDERADNIFWIAQVSDIHISRYYDFKRGPDLRDFCNSTLDVIKPDVVLVTGDLTDAKSRNKYDSMQYEDEWKEYHDIIQDTKVKERFIWLDIRGNHDAFDVLDADDYKSNPYLKYSGDKGNRTSRVYHLQKPFGTYSFIPVDATMIPGPRRPYNFEGYLTKKRLQMLQEFVEESSGSNFTIWYSHYPTSSTTPAAELRNLIGQTGGVYVAGHLHTLGGLSHSLYALNPKGFLELELADWLNNRMFRIIAIDHDMASFGDFKHNEWPVILITNPKQAKFKMPNVEPLGRIMTSSHIRFLVFDPSEVKNVEVHIDGNMLPDKPYKVGDGPLWACRWNPMLYNVGKHDVAVTVSDANGIIKVLKQQFSLDTTWDFDYGRFASFVMLSSFSTLLFYTFHSLCLGYICAIVFFRFYRNNEDFSPLHGRLRKLMQDNVIFYGVLIFAVNFMLGPWFVGELIRGTIGVCFSYGLLIDGVLQPEDIALAQYGILMLLTLYAPAPVLLSHYMSKSDQNRQNLQLQISSRPLAFSHLLFFAYHIYALWALYESYGLVSALVSPFKLWWMCFLLYAARRTQSRQMTESYVGRE